jgi:hypothetical protein
MSVRTLAEYGCAGAVLPRNSLQFFERGERRVEGNVLSSLESSEVPTGPLKTLENGDHTHQMTRRRNVHQT